MFTGLIETTGRVIAVDQDQDGRGARLRLRTPLASEMQPGDSLAVNGACLTVTRCTADEVAFDLAPETVSVTTLGRLAPGRLVNLERPLRADARLGGHFVLGHVDATSVVTAFTEDGDSWWLEVDLPAGLASLVVPKGSIAIDGISLTIARLTPDRVAAQIVPFTRAHTALVERRVGDEVNLEVDVLGKYVSRLLSGREAEVAQVPGEGP